MARIDTLRKKSFGQIDRISAQLENGEITTAVWRQRMEEEITRASTEAMKAGKGGALSLGDIRQLNIFLREQFAFLDNFKNEIDATGWEAKYSARARMYGSAIINPYSVGNVIKQAGRMLPLPAMPAEGTICHSNCNCSWDITTIKEGADYDGYWKLGRADNCQTCVQRAADWSPVQIRGMVLQ